MYEAFQLSVPTSSNVSPFCGLNLAMDGLNQASQASAILLGHLHLRMRVFIMLGWAGSRAKQATSSMLVGKMLGL